MGASFFIYCDLTKINRIPVGNPRNKTDESRTLPEILKCDPVTGSVCQCANCFLSVYILYDTHPHSNFVPFCTVLCCFFCARGFLISVRMAHRPPRATKQKALEGFHLMEEDSSNEVCRKVLFSNFCVDRNVMCCHRSPVSLSIL